MPRVKFFYDRRNDDVFMTCDGIECGSIPLGPIKDDIMEYLHRKGVVVGESIFRKISRTAKKLAQSKLLRQVRKIITSPAVQSAARVMFPPLGVAYDNLKNAAALIKSARAGDEESRRKLVNIAARAKSGEPAAYKALKVIQTVNAASKPSVAGMFNRFRKFTGIPNPIDMFKWGMDVHVNTVRNIWNALPF